MKLKRENDSRVLSYESLKTPIREGKCPNATPIHVHQFQSWDVRFGILLFTNGALPYYTTILGHTARLCIQPVYVYRWYLSYILVPY
jgi:hypothetical protein